LKDNKLSDLLKLSRRVGERFDLVQAGGGNTSVKNEDGTMYVKASGLRLSDLKSEESFVLIDNRKLQSLFHDINWEEISKRDREKIASEIVNQSNLTPDRRPSIETLLHSSLDGYILHCHPVSVTSYFSNKDSEDHVSKHCPDYAFVSYETPGIELALALQRSQEKYYKEFSRYPNGFVFQNHGLLTFAKTWEESFVETIRFNRLVSEIIGFPFATFDLSNIISDVMENITGESWLTLASGESEFNQISINKRAFFPDAVVFLGVAILELDQAEFSYIENQVKTFIAKHSVMPKVFKFKNTLYFLGKTFSKVKEVEEVWKLHHIASQYEPDSLSYEEIDYLCHWEAEKFRQKN